MTSETLHVVFNPSAAVDLRKALAQTGRRDDVVAFADDLSFGAINPPDPDRRAQWVAAELKLDGWDTISGKVRAFWSAALAHAGRRIAWMSRRSTQEFTAFLEFVSRLGKAPCEFVDMTDVTIVANRHRDSVPTSQRLALSLALVPADDILAENLLNLAQPLTQGMRESYLAVWDRLRRENTALRVLDADLTLRSAPFTFFDRQLLSCARRDWLKSARVIAEVLSKFYDEARLQTGDLVLAVRLRKLAEAGLLESQGDLSKIRFSEVRLPARRT